MTPSELREIWGPIGQIGYVVEDLEATALQWTKSIGIGPWKIFNPVKFDSLRYNGEPSDVTVGFALAFMGSVQIELIQQHNDAPSTYRDQLDTFGSGAQHICFYPEDYDAALAAGIDSGLTVMQEGDIWGVDFAYLHGTDGEVLELARLSEERRTMRNGAIEAAASWDGQNPLVRMEQP